MQPLKFDFSFLTIQVRPIGFSIDLSVIHFTFLICLLVYLLRSYQMLDQSCLNFCYWRFCINLINPGLHHQCHWWLF